MGTIEANFCRENLRCRYGQRRFHRYADESLEEAVKINEEAQKFDGIEEIKDDGTVVFTEKSVSIMREMLNYDCEELKLEESEDRAMELRALYNSFAERHR